MANILCRTKGNANPQGKPRVYFVCHPEDFSKYFDLLCEDIFKTHDCAVFYKEDMAQSIAPEDQPTDLGSHNLFIVPVTFRLLTQPNQAMDTEIPYAMSKGIPVLPFLMESNIDEFYGRKFGNRQYLTPFTTDETEIAYKEKLRKFLDSVLISEEMASRIRAEFDAYIFLSYRKKDRRYANELMKLIHRNPECRDVAIWYDEFLTPGENFMENIEKMLNKSNLFALLVTPNLLEEPDGKPNFVMGEEYPAAQKAGKAILPAEMEQTDRAALAEKFEGIPSCVDPYNAEFKQRLLESIVRIATSENDNDPVHNFLIGLAYLDGIDVETDHDRGIALITSAAESNLPEAMEKLAQLYDGQGNYQKALRWTIPLAEYYQKLHGAEDPVTLKWQEELACAYGRMGDFQKALALEEQVHNACMKLLGPEHPDTLRSLANLSWLYVALGDSKKAVELSEKAYTLRCNILGEEHPDTLLSLAGIARAYCRSGAYAAAEPWCKKAYDLRLRLFGEEHPNTLIAMNDLAVIYGDLDKLAEAQALLEKAYALRCKTSGEEHPETLTVLHNLALTYGQLGEFEKALSCCEKAYTMRCKVLGEEHPDTIGSLNNLAWVHSDLGNNEKALQLFEQAYSQFCKRYGKKYPDTLDIQESLAHMYDRVGQHHKAMELLTELFVINFKLGVDEQKLEAIWSGLNKVDVKVHPNCQRELLWGRAGLWEEMYQLCRGLVDENDPQNLFFLTTFSIMHAFADDYQAQLPILEKIYTIQCKSLGAGADATLKTLKNLAYAYSSLGQHRKALELLTKLYAHKVKAPDAALVEVMKDIASNHRALGEYEKAVEWFSQAHTFNREHTGKDDLGILSELIATYAAMNDASKVAELYEMQYTLAWAEIEHGNLLSVSDLAATPGVMDRYPKVREFYEKLTAKACTEIDGGGLLYILPLAAKYDEMGEYTKALEMQQLAYDYWRAAIGENSPACTNALTDMANLYDKLGDTQKSAQLREKVAALKA